MRGSPAFLLHHAGRQRWRLIGLAATVIGASSCAVGVQYGMKLLIDAMSAPATHVSVEVGLVVFIGLIVAESILWRLGGWFGGRVTIRAGVNIRVDLFSHLAGHAMHYFDEHMTGALGHRITATAGAFGAFTHRIVWDIIPPCINFLCALAIFYLLDGPMTAVLAGSVLIATVALVAVGLKARPLHQDYAAKASASVGELMDVVGNIWAVKSFSARNRERARLAGAFTREADAQHRSVIANEKVRILNDVSLVAMAGATLVWSVHLWRIGKISPGDVVLVSALTFRLLHGARDLSAALIDMSQHYAYIGETLRIIGKPHAVVDPVGSAPAIPRGGSIAFDRVSFGYTVEQPVLRNICVAIPAGQRVGLVGASGAGKSTITQLLQRFYEVQSGRILVDGDPVASLSQDALRDKIAAVPQQVSLFHRSVMDNIRFARPGASDREVFAAARAACCDEFVRDLPDGYDTLVGDRGAKLSGGQRQRIGIARAFLKDASILVLDEATSALDVESEAAVQLALKRLMHGRTVLAIAHRLTTLADMDRILVLQDGEIVEDASPGELRARGGKFDHLWRMQVGDASGQRIRRLAE